MRKILFNAGKNNTSEVVVKCIIICSIFACIATCNLETDTVSWYPNIHCFYVSTKILYLHSFVDCSSP
jgi:hypothetical protein